MILGGFRSFHVLVTTSVYLFPEHNLCNNYLQTRSCFNKELFKEEIVFRFRNGKDGKKDKIC